MNFLTLGFPDRVHSNPPCLLVRRSVRLLVRLSLYIQESVFSLLDPRPLVGKGPIRSLP